LFIQSIVSVIGITKTITTFWLFFQIIVSVIDITKTITISFVCLFRLLIPITLTII
jgi:hypothetical protein